MGSSFHLEGKAVSLYHNILCGEIGQGFNRLQSYAMQKQRQVYDGLSDAVNKKWDIFQWQTKSLHTLQLTGSLTY